MILKMSEDKVLTITKPGNTYQDENNAETIKIILPKSINNIDLKECHVYLSFVNQENLGQVIDLTESIAVYSDNFYFVETHMDKVFTCKSGDINLWVKILNSEHVMVAKSNVVGYRIKPHIEVEGTIPEQELSILESMAVKLDSIEDYVNELQQGDVLLVQPE